MPSDIRTAVVSVALPAGASGLRELTGAFSWVPKAALFIITRAVTNGAVANHAIIGIGATDGVNEWAITQKSEHGVGRTDDDGRGMTDECCALNDLSSGIDGEFNIDGFVTGGIRVNIGNGFASGYFCLIVFFGGSDLQVKVGNVTVPASATLDITDVGFQPDLTFVSALSFASQFNDTNQKFFSLSLGVSSRAANPPPQGSITIYERSGQSVGNVAQYVSSTEVLRHMGDASSLTGIKVQDYDVNGFSLNNDKAFSHAVGYLAIKVGDRQFWANNFSTPTVTGSFDHTDPGFKPQIVLNLMSMMTAIDTHVGTLTGDEGPAVGSFGVAAITTDPILEDFSQTISIEDASATMDTQGLTDTRIVLPQDDGSVGIVADITSFIPTGWRVNYASIVGATARRWVGFAIEEVGAAAPTQSIAGAQPSGSGLLSPTVIFKNAITGVQPSGSAVLTTKLTVSLPLVGAQSSGSGVLTEAVTSSEAILGSQPSGAGALSTKPSLIRLGVQPSALGTLSTIHTVELAVAGTQPSGSAFFTAIPTITFFRTVSGVQGDPAAVVTIDAQTQSTSGVQPSGSGLLSLQVTYKIALAGTHPAGLDIGPPGQQFGRLSTVFIGAIVKSIEGQQGEPSGVLTIDARTVSILGAQPTAVGASTLRLAPKRISLIGLQPSGSAALIDRKSAQHFRTISGIQGDPAAVLTIDARTSIVLGAQPSGSGEVTRKVTYKIALLGSQPSGTATTVVALVGTTRAVSGVQGDPSGVLTIDARTTEITGAQPSGTGVVTLKVTFKISLAGAQPAGLDSGPQKKRFGVLDFVFLGAIRISVGGLEGAPSGVLTIDARTLFASGVQPSGSSLLTEKVTYKIDLAGTQPSGSAVMIAEPIITFVRAVSGSQGDPSAVLTIVKRTVFTTGIQPSGSSLLTQKVTYRIALVGLQPSGESLLVTFRLTAIKKAVNGSQGDPSGILTIVKRTAFPTGLQPSGSGAVTTRLTAARSLVGVQAQATGVLTILETKRTIAGSQPSGSGVLTTLRTAKETVAGVQPSGSGVLTSQILVGAFVDVNDIVEIIDASKIPVDAPVLWEAHMASAGAQTHRCRLFNITDDNEVTGSIVSTSLTTVERLTSGNIRAQLVGVKEYKAQYTAVNGPKPVVSHTVTETA